MGPDINDQIQQLIAEGKSPDDIKSALLSAGNNPKFIDSQLAANNSDNAFAVTGP